MFTSLFAKRSTNSLHQWHGVIDSPWKVLSGLRGHWRAVLPIMMVYLANYSRGYVVEYEAPCFKSWLLLPAQNLWHEGLRGVLYVTAMVYIFLGIAIIADIFMSCIEVITSKKRKVTRFDPDRQERVEIEVFVWNETVANLTLMALGSSAPEILLAVVETAQNLGNEPDASREDKDGLGSFTIIGSASFNLLLITAICVVSVPSGTVKRIREFGVFIVTSAWSLFAYIWLLVVLKWSSPDEIELWEAFVTLSFFPLLVVTSWCQDNGWWCKRGRILSVDAPEVNDNEYKSTIFLKLKKKNFSVYMIRNRSRLDISKWPTVR